MSEKILVDCHNHSWYSSDCDESVETMCKSAVSREVAVYTITDHLEIGPDFKIENFELYKRYANEVRQMSAIYSNNKTQIYLGIELGEASHNIELANQVVELDDFDFVIGSLHNLKGYKDFYYLNYDRNNIDFYLTTYFDELLDIAKWNKFDVLGHLNYPIRYIVKSGIKEYSLLKYMPKITEILKTVIANGKGIEINASGLRQEIGETMPNFDIIRLYRSLGGEILTIGSDAHKKEDVAKGVDKAIELAKRAGFDHINYFVKRQPRVIKI